MERPQLEIDLEILQQQRWLREQEEQQRIQQHLPEHLPEAQQELQKHLNLNNPIDKYTEEQQKQLTDALSVQIAKKGAKRQEITLVKEDKGHLVAHLGSDFAHIRMFVTIAKVILPQQPKQPKQNLLVSRLLIKILG